MENNSFTRRDFLRVASLATAGAAASAISRLTSVAIAAPGAAARDIAIVIFLRGGWDALNVVAPLDGPDRAAYEAARPSLKIPVTGAGALLPLNAQFGLHPSLAPLQALYQSKRLALIHAVGLDFDTRSHFDAMQYIELGTPGSKNTTSGWIARHLQSAPDLPTSLLLPAIAGSGAPVSLLSYTEAISMGDPNEFSYWGWLEEQEFALREMYGGDSLIQLVGKKTLDALDAVAPAQNVPYVPANGAVYGDDSFNTNLKTLAQMIKMGVGLQAATVDLGGWDTHEYQGGSAGYMSDLLAILANGLKAFYTDLDGAGSQAYTKQLSIVVMSEFGRRLAQNESDGTDHGHGSLMLALGGGVNGGEMFGIWPGLSSEQLYDRADLDVTTDYRQVLCELLVRRLANPNLNTVFPGFTGFSPLGVFQQGAISATRSFIPFLHS
jgi:uncharacterized protein (DUF1501 family)